MRLKQIIENIGPNRQITPELKVENGIVYLYDTFKYEQGNWHQNCGGTLVCGFVTDGTDAYPITRIVDYNNQSKIMVYTIEPSAPSYKTIERGYGVCDNVIAL